MKKFTCNKFTPEKPFKDTPGSVQGKVIIIDTVVPRTRKLSI